AVVGATGLVGTVMLKVLEERNFPISQLIPVASEKSVGKMITFKGKNIAIVSMDAAIAMRPEIALFSAGGETSLKNAPLFSQVGTTVIDNSSAWRMDPGIKLIVPEVNGHELSNKHKIIANPNCSTIQMVVVLKPLHDRYKIKRVVVSTYQSVTGTGVKAVDQLMNERKGIDGPKAYPYEIDLNVLPHIDVFMDNGYTKEEMKMVMETNKIMSDEHIKVTATAVRIPVMGGHSESVNIEFEQDYDLSEVKALLAESPGIMLIDDVANLKYPMPKDAHGQDDVLVGRIRRDESTSKALNVWIVADNLRKGAATNAVQIAEYLIKARLI
ncbi:MAG: aspartate-semialdehyde dehydrogenase, partial [Pedobacter sp.]